MVFELPAEVKSKFPMNTANKVGCVLLETEKLNIERSAGDLHEEFKNNIIQKTHKEMAMYSGPIRIYIILWIYDLVETRNYSMLCQYIWGN